jgi:hypothetical protein
MVPVPSCHGRVHCGAEPISNLSGMEDSGTGVTIEDVRGLASTLERSYEVIVRDRVKFRVGQIVYLAFSRDDSLMGFAFPKEEREGLVASEPHKFMLPKAGDMRYNWAVVRLAEIDRDEMVEIVVEAWRMVVPKKVFNAYERREQHT